MNTVTAATYCSQLMSSGKMLRAATFKERGFIVEVMEKTDHVTRLLNELALDE